MSPNIGKILLFDAEADAQAACSSRDNLQTNCMQFAGHEAPIDRRTVVAQRAAGRTLVEVAQGPSGGSSTFAGKLSNSQQSEGVWPLTSFIPAPMRQTIYDI